MARLYVITALVACSLGLAIFLHTLFYSDSWTKRARVRADLEALRSANDTTEENVEQLRQQIEALRNRPEVQERVVRQELGYVRPEDVVLELGQR